MSSFVRQGVAARRHALWAGATLGLLLASAACGIDRPPPPPPSLRDAKLAKDFTLSTTRSVRVGLTADDAVFGERRDATIVLSRPNGAALFRGVIKKGAGLDVTVPLAADIESVDVRVGAAEGTRRFNFPVDSDSKSLVGHIR